MTAEPGAEENPPQLVPLNAIFATDFVQLDRPPFARRCPTSSTPTWA